jgi:TetR/AcrR family transcriptional repressor of nem operon
MNWIVPLRHPPLHAAMFEQGYANFLRKTEGLEPRRALEAYVDWYLSPAHRDAPNRGCPLPSGSGDLPRLADAARVRYTEGVERLTAAIAQLIKKLGNKNAEALALSALSEMAGALALARAIIDPERSDRMLQASCEMVKARIAVAQ